MKDAGADPMSRNRPRTVFLDRLPPSALFPQPRSSLYLTTVTPFTGSAWAKTRPFGL